MIADFAAAAIVGLAALAVLGVAIIVTAERDDDD